MATDDLVVEAVWHAELVSPTTQCRGQKGLHRHWHENESEDPPLRSPTPIWMRRAALRAPYDQGGASSYNIEQATECAGYQHTPWRTRRHEADHRSAIDRSEA